MARSSGTPLRLFVAAHPPAEARQALLDALAQLPLAPHRATPPEQVHLTLQFIGNVQARDLDGVVESVRRAAAGIGPFTITPRRLITLPEKGPPRLVAATTDAPPQLLELHRRLAHRLARNPRRDGADRYLPHLTLCRFAGDATASRLDEPISTPPFAITHIALMRSILRPGGSEHRELERVDLIDPGRGG